MVIKIIVYTCLLLSGISVAAQKNGQKIVSLIFDSDMGPDYDDVGAIALLHDLQTRV